MRELGLYRCPVSAVLDVAPDLWICVQDDTTKQHWLFGPKASEKVRLQFSPDTMDAMKQGSYDASMVTPARFYPVPTASNTYDVALGLSNGYVCVFNSAGEELFSLACHQGPVFRLEWNFHSAKPLSRELYVLFADMALVVIEWEMDPVAPKRYWRKYSLNGQRDIVGILPCRDTKASLFQSQPRAGLQTFVAVGCDPIVGFYHAGMLRVLLVLILVLASFLGHEGTSLFRMAHLASAVATRAAGAVWSLARNWGWPQDTESDTVNAVPTDLGIHVTLGLPDTSRRRARDLNLSPNGKLGLVPDTLGRILLVDTSSMLLIRLWKGYRDAQCGWMTHASGAEKGLYMVFYSARRGLIEVWRARHGPRVLCLPIGAQAKLKLCTCVAKGGTATCVVVWEQTDGQCAPFQVELDGGSTTAIMQYLSQAKREEESFLLHQLLDGVAAAAACGADASKLPPLLEQMKGLTTLTAVETLADALHEPSMGVLPASFHRDALRILLEVARKDRPWEDETQAAFADLLVMWTLEWKVHLIQGYMDLLGQVTAKSFASLFDEDELLTRMTKWNQVYQPPTAASPKPPKPLNCLQFVECFEAPWANHALSPDQELSLALLLHRTQRHALSFAEALAQVHATLQSSVVRTTLSTDLERAFVAFCFAPLHGAVFAVQHVQEIHAKLLLDKENARYTALFLDWFFALPLDQLLSMTATNASSSLQRWFQPWVQGSLYPHSIDESEFTLPELHPSLQLVFEKCRTTTQLLHASVLSHHVAHGTHQHANTLQDNTLGQVSATGAGLRWQILEQCLGQCLYLSCLLKVPGKLTVNTIESIDELMKFIAIIHLNTTTASETPDIPYDLKDAWVDAWQASPDTHSVLSVLHSFPQLHHAESLVCFRATMLCTAWTNDRSRMSYLELAIDEIETNAATAATGVRVPLVVYLWEKYIRAQVASIMTYYVELSAGKSNHKGLHPSIAGEFLRLVQQLLALVTDPTDGSKGLSLAPDHLREGSEHTLSQLLEHVVWSGTTSDVENLYRPPAWPASPRESALMRQLYSQPPISMATVELHAQLVSVLLAFTAFPSVVVPLSTLFELSRLCSTNTFEASSKGSTVSRDAPRYDFVMQVLRRDASVGMAVATAFNLPLDKVKQDHAVWLYQSGKDALAEEILDKVLVEPVVVTRLGRVARTRLSLIVSRMRSRAEYAALMSQIPADVTAWICSNQGPLETDPQVAHLDTAPSLTATNALLHQCMQWLPLGTPEQKRCHSMIGVVDRLVEQLKGQRNHGKRVSLG
ncbi:Aste57867_13709 [Aphanomyces stellatus]|uniref:Aste57867_13709 protein n=1 Tax=Aphanomyces stellatus TaxID=120398 RepID=A0A485KZJ1_9STRA|nr:hypothetical protein As57867_013659 [Aphanomyces stellatus]VFT90542.1 Aste57867_13709 [Aphanomyces stellatus]